MKKCKFEFSKFIGKSKKLELWECFRCDNWKHIIDGQDVTDFSEGKEVNIFWNFGKLKKENKNEKN